MKATSAFAAGVVVLMLVGCAPVAEPASSATATTAAWVKNEAAFVQGVRDLKPLIEGTQDAEILDFGYTLCHLLDDGGEGIVDPDDPYTRALIVLARRDLCPTPVG